MDRVHLRGIARKVEGAVRPARFRASGRATPAAVERALEIAVDDGLAERGDYYEFGLYRGYTFWFAQKVTTGFGNRSMRFVGFDSFCGLPEIQGIDVYKGDFAKGQYAVGLESVREMLDRHGVDWNRTILIPGYFENSATAATIEAHGLGPARSS